MYCNVVVCLFSEEFGSTRLTCLMKEIRRGLFVRQTLGEIQERLLEIMMKKAEKEKVSRDYDDHVDV